MEYSKEDLMEAKKQIWGVGENMGTEESKKIWEENAQFWDKYLICNYEEGEIAVRTVYDEKGNLKGLEAYTQEEFNAMFGK